jgi:hypothetical protein
MPQLTVSPQPSSPRRRDPQDHQAAPPLPKFIELIDELTPIFELFFSARHFYHGASEK